MPNYRLLAGDFTVIETFDADDDAEAIEWAHRLSLDFPMHERVFAARWGYFRLERRDHVWAFFFAWAARPGGRCPCPG
jgi:hypothetical protein